MCILSVVKQMIKSIKSHSLPVYVSRKEAETPVYSILLCKTALNIHKLLNCLYSSQNMSIISVTE
jgi:hypothetical protein